LLDKIKHIYAKNTLLKVLSFNSLAVGLRIITGFLTTKIIAVFIGPSGLPLISNFTNFLNSTKNIATLGMQEAVVAQISAANEDEILLKKRISTAFFMLLLAAIFVAIVLLFGASYFNQILFETVDYTMLIRGLALLMPVLAIQVFFVAVINGYGKYKKLIYINAITTFLGFLLSVFLIYNYLILGALLALITSQIIGLLLLFIFVKETKMIAKTIRWSYFDIVSVKTYTTYAFMALVTALTVPWVFITVRNLIINTLGKTQAGYWDAMMRISNFYLVFVGTALTLYYLPKLALLKTDKSFKDAIVNYYKTLMPLFLLGLLVVYFTRNLLVHYFLTDKFLPATDLFFYQLAADFFKVASLAFTYQFLAKKMLWQYVFTEVFFVIVFYFFTHYFLELNGLVGVVKAYFYAYIAYYTLILILFRRIVSYSNFF
jgi:PST family polysaccharide transporter